MTNHAVAAMWRFGLKEKPNPVFKTLEAATTPSPYRYGSTGNRLALSLGLLGYTDLIEQNARGVDISLKAGKVLSGS